MSEDNKATFVIVAPNNYDVKKYSLCVRNNFDKNATIAPYGFSELEFEFNQTDKNGNLVAIVEYNKSKEPLKNPRITLFNGTIDESKSYKPKNMIQDDKHLSFKYPDNNESDNDNNKSQIFKIKLCESHDETLQKIKNENLCYEYWTEEQLNEYKIDQQVQTEQISLDIQAQQPEELIQSIDGKSDSQQTKNDQVEEDKIDTENDKNNNATENNQIPLKIDCQIKNVNAFLLNGEFHSLDDKNDKICLDKNKEYKIEPVYYDAEKQRFYYLPKSNVYEFGPSDLCNIGKLDLIIDNYDASVPTFTSSLPKTSIPIGLTKPINHEKSSNLELGFGIPLALAAIGFAFALAFGGLPAIIALPFIIGLGILGGGLICKGGYDKHYTLKEPKENKSQESEAEYSDEVTQDTDIDNEDPIWTSVKSQSQDSNEDQPFFDTSNNDIFLNDEEEEWGEHII